MLTLGVFGKKKAQSPDVQTDSNQDAVILSKLKELTVNDGLMYSTMSRLLFIDPGKVTVSLEEAASQASSFEAAGDKIRAEVWYRIAGGIALYKGDAEGVRKFFEKAASFSNPPKEEYTTAAARSQEAVSIARKYYENI